MYLTEGDKKNSYFFYQQSEALILLAAGHPHYSVQKS